MKINDDISVFAQVKCYTIQCYCNDNQPATTKKQNTVNEIGTGEVKDREGSVFFSFALL